MKSAKFSAVDLICDRRPSSIGDDNAGFTRIELIVIIATVALLTITLLPALARTRVEPQGTQCLNNLRQITLSWLMYANDNGGRFAPNPDYNTPPAGVANKARWVGGDMRGGSVGAPYSGIDATNTALLTNATFSALGPYLKNPKVFKCPADQSTWSVNGVEMPRARSYSMNCAIGCAYNGTDQDPGHNAIGHWLPGEYSGGRWRVYLKQSDLAAPTPSALFLLLDEHPDSINDATFQIQMPTSPVGTYFIDLPAKYHNNASNFSFADGHVETHPWQRPQIIPPEVWAADTDPNLGNRQINTPANPDVLWLAQHTTAPAAGAHAYYP
jgi:prepilin-type processing-associated H-X9-DG protein